MISGEVTLRVPERFFRLDPFRLQPLAALDFHCAINLFGRCNVSQTSDFHNNDLDVERKDHIEFAQLGLVICMRIRQSVFALRGVGPERWLRIPGYLSWMSEKWEFGDLVTFRLPRRER